MDPQSVAPRFDQARPSQVREVPRRLGLRNLQALVDVADADLAGQQQPEDPQPGRIGQRLEQAFHLDQLLSHIFALTNITRAAYESYIRFRRYNGGRYMSDVQQAVREKYGAIAESVRKASTNTGLLRPLGVRVRRSDHARISTPTTKPAACRRTP